MCRRARSRSSRLIIGIKENNARTREHFGANPMGLRPNTGWEGASEPSPGGRSTAQPGNAEEDVAAPVISVGGQS